MTRSLASILILGLAKAALAQAPVITGTVDTMPRAKTTFSVVVIDSAQLHAVGGVIYNRVRQSRFRFERDGVYDQSGKPAADRKPGTYYAAFSGFNTPYGTTVPNSYFVESGTCVKLRELAVDWTLPNDLLSRVRLGALERVTIGVVGRNLWTNSRYSGHDPEVTAASASLFDYRFDASEYPVYRTLGAVLKMGF